MSGFFIALCTLGLILISLFLILIILMQRPSANSGMGAAMGSGMTESAFGAEASNVLTRGTVYAAIGFFVFSFGLYLASIYRTKPSIDDSASLPTFEAKASPDEDTAS